MRKFEYISIAQAAYDGLFYTGERKLPQRATKGSAGYDIYAPFKFILNAGEEVNNINEDIYESDNVNRFIIFLIGIY